MSSPSLRQASSSLYCISLATPRLQQLLRIVRVVQDWLPSKFGDLICRVAMFFSKFLIKSQSVKGFDLLAISYAIIKLDLSASTLSPLVNFNCWSWSLYCKDDNLTILDWFMISSIVSLPVKLFTNNNCLSANLKQCFGFYEKKNAIHAWARHKQMHFTVQL